MGPAQNVRWSLKIGENEDDGSERQRAATAIAATTKLCDVTHLWCNSIFPHSRQIQSNLSVDDCIYVRHGLVPTFYQFCPCERWSPLTRSVRVCMCVSTLKTWVSAPMHSSGTQQIFLYVIIVAPMVAIIIKSQCLASIGIANFLFSISQIQRIQVQMRMWDEWACAFICYIRFAALITLNIWSFIF